MTIFGLGADARSEVSALRKSQAVIEFSLDGTILDANDNFCRALGYSLAEIKGKHHRMFVDASEVETSDYRNFGKACGRVNSSAPNIVVLPRTVEMCGSKPHTIR